MINIKFRCDLLYMAKFTVYYFVFCDCNHGVTYRRAHVAQSGCPLERSVVSFRVKANLLWFVYICVAFGDPIINR